MSKLAKFVRSAIVGGFFVVLPIVLVLFLLDEALQMMVALTQPVVEQLPAHMFDSEDEAVIVAALIILAVCFTAGLLMETRVGPRVVGWLESTIFSRLPAYDLIKRLTQRVAGQQEGIQFAPALVDAQPPGSKAFAFIVEEHANGDFTVFIPSSPTPTLGRVLYVEKERVHKLDASLGAVSNCLMQWGIGSQPFFEEKS